MTIVHLPYTNGIPIMPVNFCATSAQKFSLANTGMDIPEKIKCNMKIDTGSRYTYLHQDIVGRLALAYVGTESINLYLPAASNICAYKYDADIAIDATVQGSFAFSLTDHEIIAADFSNVIYDGILGRDILRYCESIFNGLSHNFNLIFAQVKMVKTLDRLRRSDVC